jgi:hypothetical protein
MRGILSALFGMCFLGGLERVIRGRAGEQAGRPHNLFDPFDFFN